MKIKDNAQSEVDYNRSNYKVLPYCWWYEGIVDDLIALMIELEKFSEWLKDPESDQRSKELFTNRVRSFTGLYMHKIRNGCKDIGNYRADQALTDRIAKNFPNNIRAVTTFCENCLKEFSEKVKWEGFDKEIFPRDAELATTQEAIDYRQNRGFNWQWKELQGK